jgi:tetratricopeptide (TPR) repeat protein
MIFYGILWINKGDALRLSGRHGEAIEDYDKALELNPKNEVV